MIGQENNGFGPIPRRRGTGLVKAASILFAMLFMSVIVLFEFPEYEESFGRRIRSTLSDSENSGESGKNLQSLARVLFVCSVAIVTLVISEAIRRFCLLVEEIRHRHERYDGNLLNVVAATYRVNHYQSLSVMVVLAVVFLVILSVNEWTLLWRYLGRYGDLVFANMAVACLVNVFFSLKTPSDVEISEFSEKDHLNVAHGLAWSFYFGYLKIILPELENTIAKSKWNNEMKEGGLLAKLFIVIPEDCVIPDNLGEDYPHVKFEEKLPPLEVDRAGVKKRHYVNSVYQVTDPSTGYAHYCILEYATPVDSLYRMSGHPEAGLNARDRHQQVQIFMRTLQQILDKTPECGKRCVLVPISGRDYERFPLAHVILKAIKQVKGEQFDIEGVDGEEE